MRTIIRVAGIYTLIALSLGLISVYTIFATLELNLSIQIILAALLGIGGVSAALTYVIYTVIIRPVVLANEKDLQEALKKLKEINTQMREDQDKDKVLLNNIGDAVVAIDTNRRVIFINNVAAHAIGWQHEEVVGKKWGTDMPKVVDERGNAVPREHRSVQTAWETKQSVHVSNYYYLRKDGSKFPVSITTTPIISDNRITGAMILFRDVTREKEIDRMKTEFISLASHQLRTPLSAIKWYLRMMLDGDAGELTQRQQEFVTIINESNERMITLVNDLLNISRIESGRIIIDPKPTNLRALIGSVVRELGMRFKEKQLSFKVTIDPEIPVLSIDPNLIRHVYMNLLTNAIKYTPATGAVTLTVTKNQEFVISSVTDTGYGIPAADQSKIFEKFYRSTNVLKYETSGTGLGLYLAKAIVQSSGGTIGFESTEGAGSTFTFTLPLTGSSAKPGEVTLEDKFS